MTPKQKRFCEEYLIDLNARKAAIRAGYSASTASNASRWLDKKSTKKYNPEMEKYISDRMAGKNAELIASQDEVLQYLTAVLRNEKTEQAVVVEGVEKGVSEARIIEKDVSIRDRNKAAELLAKRYGLLTDNMNLNADVGVTIIDDLGE